jgi:adenylate cyclase, class 2
MRYEVELKFPVADLPAFVRELTGLKTTISAAQEEIDLYLAHPSRDFAQTDEALRLRRKGETNQITYKGPKIDTTTKTRREIELPLAPGSESLVSWQALLEALGFRPVAEVHKSRRKAKVIWQDREVEVSLDDVREVGTYVEFELVVDENELEAAKACIQSLAQSFGLTQGERRSYLGMMLERRGGKAEK